jgi:hypothetical protein
MAAKPKRSGTHEPDHDEDRRATLGKVIATAAGAFVVSSGIAGAQQRKQPQTRPLQMKPLQARTTEMIPRQVHSKLSPRARSLTRKDLQAIAAGSFSPAQRERLKDVTFGDLKSIFEAVAASARVSDATLVVPPEGVVNDPDFPPSCCCTCCK